MSRGVGAKPPNVLVLCGGRNPPFSSVRDSLVASLNPERYVVYPLPLADVSRAPWRDNCSLLVVPSGLQLAADAQEAGEVLGELESFVAGGGTLLCTHALTNAAFGFGLPNSPKESRLVQIAGGTPGIQPDEWIVAQTSSCSEVGATALPPSVLSRLPQLKASKVLARMREVRHSVGGPGKSCEGEGEGVGEGERVGGEGEGGEGGGGGEGKASVIGDCIQLLQFEGSLGQVVLSHVDLLSPAGHEDSTASLSEMVALKQDAGKVSNLLQAVLREIGMECCKGESSALTLSYLLCSDKVYIWLGPLAYHYLCQM